jgi:hypothetical protein
MTSAITLGRRTAVSLGLAGALVALPGLAAAGSIRTPSRRPR